MEAAIADKGTGDRKAFTEEIPAIMVISTREDMTMAGGTEQGMKFPPGLAMMMQSAAAAWTGKKQV